LLRQIADALDYAHSKGVVHRDIKSNNIMFDDRGNAYLVDFGIARLVAEPGATVTQTGAVIGTPAYIPPEVWRGEAWTRSADQYALGVVVYEMLSGRPPFEAPTLYHLIHQHLNDLPPAPQNWREEVPAALTPVLQRALAKTPEDRFPSATALADAFDESVIEALSTATTAVSGFFSIPIENASTTKMLPGLAGGLLVTPSPAAPPAPTPVAPPARRIGLWAGLAGALIVAVVLALLFVQQSSTASALQATATAESMNSASLQGTLVAIKATQAFDAMIAEPDMMTATAAACQTAFTPRTDGGSGEIAFHSNRDGSKDIYLMNADGSNVRRLTDAAGDDMNPIWSPNGRNIVFTSTRDGNNRIYALLSAPDKPDQFTTQALTPNTADNGDPAWSPDNKRIAFASQLNGNWDIYVVNADGSDLQRLTDHEAEDRNPVWSPDGKQLAFLSKREGNGELYVMDADGKNVRRLTKGEDNKQNDYAWSPDGNLLAFTSIDANNNWDIYTIALAADAAPTKRTPRRGAQWLPKWSPDGRTLGYLWQQDHVDIMLISPDGTQERNVISAPSDDWTYSWSPDSGRIAFETDRDGNWEIYTVNLCGGDLRRLTNSGAEDLYPAWRPKP
jgi:Tol biopolymer transport system component